MNVRFFDMKSGTITFASGVVTLQMPRRTRDKSRTAIIGITAIAVDPQDVLLVNLTQFNVGSRQYVQGDVGGVSLGVIAQGAVPLGTNSGNAWAQFPYFPCSRQVNPDGTVSGHGIPLPGGKFAGGILVRGGELITISLAEVQAGSNPISQIVLHFAQFDDAPSAAQIAAGDYDPALEAFWENFSKGYGQIHFHGSTVTTPNGAVVNTRVDQIIHSPYTCRVRRLEYRGLKTSATAVVESTFALESVIVSTDTENNHQVDPVGTRTVIGHAALQFPGALMVDLYDGGHSLIQYSGPDPGADTVTRLVGIFEGQPDNQKFLCGPNAF